jgi:ChrB-like protein
LQTWLLLLYKIPPHPTARRVYVWRKLKRLGAIVQHDAVWILPATSRTREQFQWLASEIVQMQGESTVWEAQLTLPSQDELLIRRFTGQVDRDYRRLQSDLKRKRRDLSMLSRRFQQAQSKDYFHSKLGHGVRDALTSARGARE